MRADVIVIGAGLAGMVCALASRDAGAAVNSVSEKRLKMDLSSALFRLQAVLTAGEGRIESRGCFLRSDYPLKKDSDRLRNSILSYDPTAADFTVRYEPVG
jgi:succinate dehydrogenase/fumarate reductase flavoprotein subunit